MIQRLSHAAIYVLDQNAAYDFYINKLGFEIRSLIQKGAMGTGVFETADRHKTYEEPTDRFYGIEALFKDNSGNWFSLTQRK